MSRFTAAVVTWTGGTISGRAEICLLSPLVYEVDFLGSGWVVEAPAGFCCDGPSVPGWALRFLPIGQMMRSAVVHDRMRKDLRRSKLWGDVVFLEAMGVEGVRIHWRVIAFLCVLANFNR